MLHHISELPHHSNSMHMLFLNSNQTNLDKLTDEELFIISLEKNEKKIIESIEDDHIASKEIKDGNVNRVSVVSKDIYKKVVQLVLKNTTQPHSLKILTPKEVIFEGGREVNIELPDMENILYVYDRFMEYLPKWNMNTEEYHQKLNARWLNETIYTFLYLEEGYGVY